jgi:hypothetical protein
MNCHQRETLLSLVRQLQERGLDVRIGWIDCVEHGKHAAHFRHSRVAKLAGHFPKHLGGVSAEEKRDPWRSPGSLLTQKSKSSSTEGIRPKPHAEQILLPLKR